MRGDKSFVIVMAVLFTALAFFLDAIHFWNLIGMEHPHGFLYQGLLFLGVLWVLQTTVFEPYLKILDLREAETTEKRAWAEDTRLKADRVLAEYRQKIEDARLKAIVEREKLALEAEETERAMLSKTRDQAQENYRTSLAELEVSRSKAEKDLETQKNALAKDIAAQVEDILAGKVNLSSARQAKMAS